MMRRFEGRLLGSLVGLILGAACGGGGDGAGTTTPPGDQPADPAAAPAETPSGDVVRAWSEIGYDAAKLHDKYARPHYDDRAWAFAAIAMHDAINACAPRYETFAYTEQHAGGDPVAAAAQAAHDILMQAFPKQAAMLDEKLASSLGPVPGGEAKEQGIAAGKGAAKALLDRRVADGFDKPSEFKPTTNGFGAWQYTPPLDKLAYNPHVGVMTTFALTRPDQFLSAEPPAFKSDRYARDFEEVKTVGAKDSKTRTADQGSAGKYWYEFSVAGWNRIARIVSADKKSDLWETAHLFALINIALWDGWIAGFNAKYHYAPRHGIRPRTAIRNADKDPNRKTARDKEWEPYMGTPPVPDYPSTHSVLGAAAATVLAHVYGDDTEFTMASPSADPPGGTRTFKSFSQAAEENANTRVWIGIHFRYAIEAGLEQGRKVGEHAIATVLRKKG